MSTATCARVVAVFGVLAVLLLFALASLYDEARFARAVVRRRLTNAAEKTPSPQREAAFHERARENTSSNEAPAAATTCGIRGASTGERLSASIVNGHAASECDWNWQVGLRYVDGNSSFHFCGGSLISNKWVLTAAHCVPDEAPCGPYDIRVVVGDYNRSDKPELVIDPSRIIRFPGYVSEAQGGDWALIELAVEVTLGNCIGTVCLPTASETVGADTTCYVTGWGTLSEGGPLPSLLQEASVETVSIEDCNKSYNGSIMSDMLCAQGESPTGVSDSCQGDSGGPLVCEAEDHRYVLQGVTSWGLGCGERDYPGVYSRVTSAVDWIHNITSSTSSSSTSPCDDYHYLHYYDYPR